MKRIEINRILFFGIFIATAVSGVVLFSCRRESSDPSFAVIEQGFRAVPDTVQTSVYWYWLSDNISKEGVVKDLEAMKRAGINRAFIGNIGLGAGDVPYGKVKIFSEEWWDILDTALKTATRLNIAIGIFNSPGWSQSGGPWVKPEQAMRYLTSSAITVNGPQKLSVCLLKPLDFFQDVKVIAYPVVEAAGQMIDLKNARITSSPEVHGISKIADGDLKTGVTFPQDGKLIVDFECKEPKTIRSILVYPLARPLKVHAELFEKTESAYRLVKTFEIDRSNPGLNVGFDPYGPVVISLPATTSKDFRVVFLKGNANSGIAELNLSVMPREERYIEKTLAKMFQSPHPMWSDYMWKDQPVVSDENLLIDPAQVKDITSSMDSLGTLNWNVPAGQWRIVRSGMTPTGVKNSPASPEGTGLEVDKMSKEHIREHFNAFLGEMIRRIPAEDRKSWKYVVEDSYEQGGQNWTDGFIHDFKSCYGYDPVPYLPVLLEGAVVGSRDVSDRFLWDLRRIVADKVAYDYVGGLRDVSHQHGMTTWLENYGHWGFPGEFLQYGGQSDEIGGEFWSEGDLGDIENRAASSCAHIYGKRKVSAESFTCAGAPFSRYPAVMKQRGDRFFTEGINNTLLHVYIEQPYEDKNPGMNAWFGNEFNRKNTWFNDMDLFTVYLKRCNFMLQQGNYVADAAYFIGEDVPKMTGICDAALPKGYSFDYINGEVLRERVKVEDGKLVLPDGMKYRILVLPKEETMRPELLRKIKELVMQGAVVMGPAPKRSPSLQNYPKSDQQVKALADSLWGEVDGERIKSAKIGKGMILSGMSMQEAFDLIDVKPDFKVKDNDPVLFIHRTLPSGDIYFLSNQSEKTITINPEFRVTGKRPELWNAVSGAVRNLPAYTVNDSNTMVPLKLEALESAFIVFRDKTGQPEEGGIDANFPEPQVIATFSEPWAVTFDAKQRGPAKPVMMATLQDWTSFSNDSIKYYSGTAAYRNEFVLSTLPDKQTVFLDLGKLTAMAKVRINGQYVGGVWTAPWRVDITKAVKEGDNKVEIAVVNTWMNRLIGDSKLPEKERGTWCPVDPYTPSSPLQSSGLFGPVKILSVKL